MIEAPYRVRRATPDDAEAIASCFRASYTDYPYTDFLDPAKIRTMASNCSLMMLALERGENVVGTATNVYREGAVELGRAVIHPDHRGLRHNGKGAFHFMIDLRIQDAVMNDARVIHSTGVT